MVDEANIKANIDGQGVGNKTSHQELVQKALEKGQPSPDPIPTAYRDETNKITGRVEIEQEQER